MAGFIPLRRPTDAEIRRATLANAVGSSTYVVSIGSALQPGATGHNSYVTVAASSSPILGVVTGIVLNGKVCELNSCTGVNSALTGTPSTGPGTDNETYNVWAVDYIPSWIPMEYTATLSAAAGTTTNSGGFGYFNLVGAGNSTTLDETSVLLFTNPTTGQFWSRGVTSYSTTTVVGHFFKTL